jgi:hypothetical protein
MIHEERLNHPKYQEQLKRVNLHEIHPIMRDWSEAFLDQLKEHKFPFFVYEGQRTPERQEELRKAKRSKAGPWQSPHQYGCAVDIIHSVYGWMDTQFGAQEARKRWKIIGTIGKEVARRKGYKITWGGDWRFYDPAHWELSNWKDYKALVDIPRSCSVADLRLIMSKLENKAVQKRLLR